MLARSCGPHPDHCYAADADVAHGIFRSSPFFLAIQNAYATAGAPEKAELFFKLHELQTCSWGVSKIGRVAQTIKADEGMLYSEFDTNLLSLTVIPILGWFKVRSRAVGRFPHSSSRESANARSVHALPARALTDAPRVLWLPFVPAAADVWRLCHHRLECQVERRSDRDGGRVHNEPTGARLERPAPVARRHRPHDCRCHLEPARPGGRCLEALAVEQGPGDVLGEARLF